MSQSGRSPGSLFRKALQEAPLVIPGAYNALVARMAEEMGFRAVYQSGAALSAAVAAVPDVGLMTQTEFSEQARYLTAAVDIPVISDADTGFGNGPAVERTVQLFEKAGLAGLHLEDQQLPKRCGHLSGKSLVSCEEMAAKIKLAVSSKSDSEFVIIARTDARSVSGFDDAVHRARAYVDAGADIIFPEALQSREEFQEFASAVDAPLMANMTEFGKSPVLSANELGDLGYAAVLYPVTLLRLAMKAVERGLKHLSENGSQTAILDQMQSRQELYDILQYEDFEKRDREHFS